MRLADARAKLRRNLSGSATDWSNEVLDGAVARAVEDLDRLYPQEKIDGQTLTFAITGEVWDSGTLGSTVTLANKRIRPKSETVTDTTGATTYVRNTDFTIDYALGTIVALASGSIPDSQADLLIDYTILEVYIDISSLTNLIRIVRVEYPAGNVPADFQSFYTWGDFIVVTSRGRETQQRMTEDEHVWIYYNSQHTMPEINVDGSWKPQLDEVVIKGAEAYSLMTKGLEVRHGARTRLNGALTTLEGVSAIEAQIDTALANTFTQASSASDDLSNVQTYIDDMTAVLAAVSSYLASAADAVVSALERAEAAEATMVNVDAELVKATDVLTNVTILISDITTLINSSSTSAAVTATYLAEAFTYLTETVPMIREIDDKVDLIEASRNQAKARLIQAGDKIGNADFYIRQEVDEVLNAFGTSINDPISNVSANILAAGNELIAAVAASDRVNVGEIVSEMHRRIGETWLTSARLEYDTWLTWLGRVDRRLAQGGNLINEASEYRLQGDSFLNEANIVLGEINLLLGQISGLQGTATGMLELGQKYLSQGQNYIGAANTAGGAAGRGIEQANAYMSMARVRIEAADKDSEIVESYVAASTQYINMAQAKIAEANALKTPVDAILERVGKKIEVAKVYQQEADRRIQQINLRQQEVDRHIGIAVQELVLAGHFEERGSELKVEFMGILMDRAQLRIDTSLSPTRQGK